MAAMGATITATVWEVLRRGGWLVTAKAVAVAVACPWEGDMTGALVPVAGRVEEGRAVVGMAMLPRNMHLLGIKVRVCIDISVLT